MSSTIKVDEIQTAVGGTTILDTKREFDAWRLSANFTTGDSIITGWERADGDDASVCPVPVGTGLTEESGVFSFPVTGYYRIDATILLNSTIQNFQFTTTAKVSNDNGSNYINYVTGMIGNTDADDYQESCSMKFFINVKNTSGSSATKFNFTAADNTSGETVLGDTDMNLTYFTCQRLAPAQ